MAIDQDASQRELSRLRAAVLADGALQDELQAFDDVDAFIARARARGYDIEDAAFRQALRGDPLGASRFSDEPPSGAIPQRGWLPVAIVPAQGQFCVDWAWFGARSLTEPFFEDSMRRALHLPLNRLVRHRTRLADLAPCVAQQAVPPPSGFIFHMSRCGSTLVSQMLATDPSNIVISEAAPIDSVVQFDYGAQPGAADAHAAMLAAMIGALGQRRSGSQARSFVKLDSWHTLALPLFRRAFPSVPWIFMYREPAEVLGSQLVQRGIQTVPEYLPPALFGLSFEDSLDSDDYCARVLSRTCEGVLEPYAQGGGLLVNYRELPQALWTRILPHFGIACGAEERAVMAAAAQFDAKSPGLPFSASSDAKRRMVTDELRAVAARHLGAVYDRLEDLRLQDAGPCL